LAVAPNVHRPGRRGWQAGRGKTPPAALGRAAAVATVFDESVRPQSGDRSFDLFDAVGTDLRTEDEDEEIELG